MSTDTDTSWIVPGAEVAVYRHSPIHGDEGLTTTTVEKVAAKSFTVASLPRERFQLATMKSKSSDFTNYVVVSPQDPKVAEVRARDARSKATGAAMRAVEDWNMGARRADPDRVQAAIDALTALRDTL